MSTHPSLNQWSFLDPALMQKQIEIAHGSIVFTSQAVLDPHLMEAQIDAVATDGAVFAQAGILDPFWTPVSLSAAIAV